MLSDKISEELTYVGKEPGVQALRQAYNQTLNELDSYFVQCRTSYDDRRNEWPGKSRDLRKHGSDAFPWEGAADMESHVIDERVTKLVSLFISSMKRANIRAYPVEMGDISRSKIVTNFLKWMVSSGYIPRVTQEMELGANYMLERGLLITYVGWHREDRRFLQTLDINQIAQISPELAAIILEGNDDEQIIQLIKTTFDGVTDRKAKRALKEIRKSGVAELPVVRRQIDVPDVKTLAPDGDFMFPAYVTDPQSSPY